MCCVLVYKSSAWDVDHATVERNVRETCHASRGVCVNVTRGSGGACPSVSRIRSPIAVSCFPFRKEHSKQITSEAYPASSQGWRWQRSPSMAQCQPSNARWMRTSPELPSRQYSGNSASNGASVACFLFSGPPASACQTNGRLGARLCSLRVAVLSMVKSENLVTTTTDVPLRLCSENV